MGGGDFQGEALCRQGNLFGQSLQYSHAPTPARSNPLWQKPKSPCLPQKERSRFRFETLMANHLVGNSIKVLETAIGNRRSCRAWGMTPRLFRLYGLTTSHIVKYSR